jgi:UDP-N-acetylmuramoylalanine--D-glutamate ligase
MEEAVITAFDVSKPGDIILLSPASASWDQYKTYEERGEHFIRSVQKVGGTAK